jgi:CRISPR-associated protein Csm1
MREPEKAVVVAALLHDIGKFSERAGEELPEALAHYRGEAEFSHEPFSASFADEFANDLSDNPQTVSRIVLKHHSPSSRDELIVSIADRLSAFEPAEADNDKEGARGRADSALRTVLSRLASAKHPLFNRLASLSFDQRDILFPTPAAPGSTEAYRELWQHFIDELRRVPQIDFTTLLALLRKFAWSIPSDTRADVVADVSLYHHLKTSAAIAACLAQEELSEDELRTLSTAITRLYRKESLSQSEDVILKRDICALVKGDISGTQDFLYLLTSSGAARGLRGRSFYLQLLTEVIPDWLLQELKAPASNLIFAGGGHFYLLLPFTATKERIETLRGKIARKLLKSHEGDLSLTLDYVPVAAIDLLEEDAGGKSLSNKWAEVSRQVSERKQRKWSDLGGEIMEALFAPRQHGTTAESMCQVCQNELQSSDEEGVRKGIGCLAFEDLGRQLRKPAHIVIFRVEEEESEARDWQANLRRFGASAHIIRAGDAAPIPPSNVTGATVFTVDRTDFVGEETLAKFSWGDLPVSYDFRLLASATPSKLSPDGKAVVAEFNDLADASEGVRWLGVLRMDVDSLGQVFKEGLGKKGTLSRTSALSESIRLFFEAWVPHLCKQYNEFDASTGEGEDRLFLVYAGGDDLFLVGPWSVLPDLACQIRDEFREFVGGDHITLSAGVAIEHQKFPLYQLANAAKRALDDGAKEFTRSGRSKDAVSYLQTPMRWDRFTEVACWRSELVKMLKADSDRLPRALITRLNEIHALYEANAFRQRYRQRKEEVTPQQLEEEIYYSKWMWRLVYHMSRFGERHKLHKHKIDELQRDVVRKDDGLIPILHVLARWTSLLIREE